MTMIGKIYCLSMGKFLFQQWKIQFMHLKYLQLEEEVEEYQPHSKISRH